MRREDVPDSNLTSLLGCSVPGYTTEETPLDMLYRTTFVESG